MVRGSSINLLRHRLLACSILLLSFAPAASADDTGNPPVIPQSLLLAYLADNTAFTLVDVRSPAEFNAAHIAGAINVPVAAVGDSLTRLPQSRDALIVVYCKTGKRAAMLRSSLEKHGYTDVRVLRANQIVWYDGMAVFNCATPSNKDSVGKPAARLDDDLWEQQQ